MAMVNIPDGVDAYASYDAEQSKKIEMLPVCSICENPIFEEKAVYYNDEWCCKECEEYFWWNIREDFLERTDNG